MEPQTPSEQGNYETFENQGKERDGWNKVLSKDLKTNVQREMAVRSVILISF